MQKLFHFRKAVFPRRGPGFYTNMEVWQKKFPLSESRIRRRSEEGDSSMTAGFDIPPRRRNGKTCRSRRDFLLTEF
ncbi:hypothetical protein B4135_0447 [Caldibacillus debilis]|uniref:Uncharacterized protein n=1 Tax=Caldibacillus debilis TaxID=301148 RepID=A0A150L924_9BACI|nr:hypothetical protein B4135_0447 [Caldibacillus debilis]